MPSTLYRQAVDSEGNISYEPVEQIPDELIYQDKRYRDVVDESVSRRTKVKELSEQLEAVKAQATKVEAPVDTPAPIVAAPPEVVKVPSVDELYLEFKTRQAAELAQQTEAQKQLLAIAAEHGLDASYLPILEEARDPKKVAAELGRKSLSFASGQVNTTPTSDPSALFTKINKELGLK